ncbi:MAG TPA: GAF domain-containing protein [Pyrinomonadaceae bacterium]|nr:GAF domain-containing protein [Pyrinomonadaceae bacterium]
MSSVDLEKSLRADVESYVAQRTSGLKEELERLRAQLNEALARMSERLEEPAAEGDAPLAVAVAEHLRNARNLGIEAAAAESARARASSDIALIKAAVDELDAQHTQAEILNALVNRAAAFAPRVAFFVVKSERATGWRARGLEGTVGDDSVRELSLALEADTLLGEVVRTRSTWAGEPGSHAEDHTIYQHFGGEPPHRMVAVPLVAREKAVAVLYADSAGQDADAVNLEAIETIVRVAGMAVELLAARAGRTAAAPASAPAPRPAPPRREEPRREEARREEPRAEEPRQEEPVRPQPSFEAQPTASEAQREPEPEPTPAFGAEPSESSFTTTPAPPSFGDRPEFSHPESFSTTPPAPEPAAQPVSPLGSARRYGSMDMDFPVEVNDEEKRYHNEARRFARLLVSEIKLYNEQKVREGRDASDLYDRLREDIDRSRQMYDKRVRPEVASRYDYFDHELVNMLAEGDRAKLGADYPGATVNA